MNTVDFLKVSDDYVTPNSPNVGEYLIANGFPPDREDVYARYPCYRFRGQTLALIAAHVQERGATLRYVTPDTDGSTLPTKAASLAEKRQAAVADLVECIGREKAANAARIAATSRACKFGMTDIQFHADAGGGPCRVEITFDDEPPAAPAPAESWPAWTDAVAVSPLKVGTRTTFAQVPVGHWFSVGFESRKRYFRKVSNRRATVTGDPGEDRVDPQTRVTYEGEREPAERSGW